MPQAQQTVLEIDLNALKHNLEFLRSKLNPDTKILAVLKAFAYGTDPVIIARKLEKFKVDYFAVAYVQEGIFLREAGVKTPILVLHPQPVNFKLLIDHDLEPSLYNARVLKAFIKAAEQKGQGEYPVHIKFNTGLNRLGFWENDLNYILGRLNETSSVRVKSLFSHLAASEDVGEADFTRLQIASFKKIAQEFTEKAGYKVMLHQCNTSGVLNYPEAHFDMVRLGIGLHGYSNDAEIDKNLMPVSTLKSIISQIHKIEPNESVGYNRAFKAAGFMKTATIPIGHADGIHRALGNSEATVKINGQKAAIIGNVCMDMLMVDISNIDCKEGEEVIIFDDQKSLNELAFRANTISYEVLTAISQRVKRIVK